MRSVRLFDFLQFDNASWQVVAQDGTELALKNLATNRIRRVSVAELLADDSYLPDSPGAFPSLEGAAVLETLDTDARDRLSGCTGMCTRWSTVFRPRQRREPRRHLITISETASRTGSPRSWQNSRPQALRWESARCSDTLPPTARTVLPGWSMAVGR